MGALAEMERELIVERTKAGWKLLAHRDELVDVVPNLHQTMGAGRAINCIRRSSPEGGDIYDVGVSTLYKKFPVGDK